MKNKKIYNPRKPHRMIFFSVSKMHLQVTDLTVNPKNREMYSDIEQYFLCARNQ